MRTHQIKSQSVSSPIATVTVLVNSLFNLWDLGTGAEAKAKAKSEAEAEAIAATGHS